MSNMRHKRRHYERIQMGQCSDCGLYLPTHSPARLNHEGHPSIHIQALVFMQKPSRLKRLFRSFR